MHAQLSMNLINVANVSNYPQPNACQLWNSELHEHAAVCTRAAQLIEFLIAITIMDATIT